jgi:hypothetical protein
MENNWTPFDALELIPKKKWPRVVVRRFFEINPLGDIRYLDAKSRPPRFRDFKPVIIAGKKYFMPIVGWSHGNMVIIRQPIDELIKKFII